MRRLLSAGIAAGLALAVAGPAAAALQPERVVLLMRHGVRPPTHEPALDPAIAPDPWPAWTVAPGLLTPHGAAAIKLLAEYDRAVFGPLAPPGKCPDIAIYADAAERTLKTGQAYAAGFAPGCRIKVGHAASRHDPLFSGLDKPPAGFDAGAAKAAMLAAAGGDVAKPVAENAVLFDKMQTVLQAGGKAFLALPAGLTALPGRKPELTGPIAEGASAAEDFLLEYLEGLPMDQVGWGRVSTADIGRLLALHPLAYTITARPKVIADAAAAPLAARIATALATGPAVTVLVGHDTNIAQLGGMLGLHWQLGGYPADDPPPGGGLLFTLLKDSATGTQYVTVSYQVQSMAQIRDLAPLSAANPPALQRLPIPGCGNNTAPASCTLAAFAGLMARH